MAKTETLFDHETGSRLLTAKEAARYLNYHLYSIYRLALQRVIRPQRKAGKTLLFLKEELDRFKVSNAWAAKKAFVDKLPVPPPRPPTQLKATVLINLGLSLIPHAVESNLNFTWDQIPLIHARIGSKYGCRPSEIRINSPEGGCWRVLYEPPNWIDKVSGTIKQRLKGG